MRLYCSNGHLVTPRRTYVNGVTGEVRCKTCKRDAMRACRAAWRLQRLHKAVDWWESRRYAERN